MVIHPCDSTRLAISRPIRESPLHRSQATPSLTLMRYGLASIPPTMASPCRLRPVVSLNSNIKQHSLRRTPSANSWHIRRRRARLSLPFLRLRPYHRRSPTWLIAIHRQTPLSSQRKNTIGPLPIIPVSTTFSLHSLAPTPTTTRTQYQRSMTNCSISNCSKCSLAHNTIRLRTIPFRQPTTSTCPPRRSPRCPIRPRRNQPRSRVHPTLPHQNRPMLRLLLRENCPRKSRSIALRDRSSTSLMQTATSSSHQTCGSKWACSIRTMSITSLLTTCVTKCVQRRNVMMVSVFFPMCLSSGLTSCRSSPDLHQ